MSLSSTDAIHISFQELAQAKRFLETQPRIQHSNPKSAKRCEREERKRVFVYDNTKLTNRSGPRVGVRSPSYPSNHGILMIPTEIDSILRSGCNNLRSSQKSWDRLCECGAQLGELLRREGRFNSAIKLSEEMRELAADLIQSDIEFCAEHSVETELWHRGEYALIERLRENARRFPESRREYLSFLQSSEHFYSNLVSSIQSSHEFSLSIVDTIRNVEPSSRKRKVLKAVVCCHFAFLALGDILRYQLILKESTADINVVSDWSTVEGHYLHAMQLAPEKGQSYHQLAIVATTQQHTLDAIYFYIRCLTAGNPIMSVRECLVQVFHSIEKKNLDSLNKVKQQTRTKTQKFQIENEVWIIPDNLMKPVSSKPHNPEYLDPPSVAKRTISPGSLQKLYKFDSAFSTLMKIRSSQSLADILIKMQFIVLFSLTNNTTSKSSQLSKLEFLLTFHSTIFQSFLTQIQNEVAVSSWYLLPHVRIFIQWLRHYKDVWQDSVTSFCRHRIWPNLFQLLNQLMASRCYSANVLPTNVLQWEDQILTGCALVDKFIPVKSTWKRLHIDPEDEVSREFRISLILDEMKLISSQTEIPIKFHENKFILDSVSDLGRDKCQDVTPKAQNSDTVSIEDDIFDESQFISDEEEVLCVHSEDPDQKDYILLKTEKDRLMAEVDKKTSELKISHSKISNKLDKATFQRHEISPRYIVPDTNCYLSSLHLIQKLYTCSTLQLIIPLIVLQELEQLRIPYSTSPKHTSSAHKAKEAYSWLQLEFSNSDRKLLALTIQGHLVDSPSYQQDFSSVRNQRNDDLILQACVKLNSQKEEECLRSSVVLVTSDRNLRLKAQSFFLPAKSLTRFLSILDIKF